MFKKRQLKEEYLKFLGEYTSINTVGFNFKSSLKGKFCGLFDCETYFDYAIAFDDKIKPNEFDQIFQLYSPVVYDWADIIDTYVYRIGIGSGNYEVATVLGLFKSVVGLVLILLTNKVISKMGGEGIW